MAVLTGTLGSDVYAGTIGVADTAVFDTLQNTVTFRWATDRWTTSGFTGQDELVSIEVAQFADAALALRGPGSFNFGNSLSADHGQAGSVAVLTDGSFMHTFARYSSTFLSFEIFRQRISADGELLTAPLQVNSSVNFNQFGPDVAQLTTGDTVIVWSGYDGAADGVFFQRINAAGVVQNGEVAVVGSNATNDYNGEVTPLTGGRFLVTWQRPGGDASGQAIYGRLYVAGSSIGSEFRINTSTTGDQLKPSIVALSDGGFAATYHSNGNLMFQRFDSIGAAIGIETNLGVMTNVGHETIARPGDRIVVATIEADLVKLFTTDASGQVLDTPRYLAGDPGSLARSPAIAALSDGGYVVAWFSYNNTTFTFDIDLQRFDSTGQAVSDVQTAARDLISYNWGIEIAADAAGGFVLQYHYDVDTVQSVRFDADTLAVLPSITGVDANDSIRAAADSTSGVRLNGQAGSDSLFGTDQADILDGGDGNDRLVGGLGNDVYVVTQADRITETAAGGIDTVIARFNYVLTAQFVENIEIKGSNAVNVTGNRLGNRIIGNTRDNQINGGRGNDTMIGGGGDDTYFVDSGSDAVIERAGEGTDTVVTSTSYVLDTHVENLVATGTAEIQLIGNSGDNVIIGNNSANSISSLGGADILEGRGGDDGYLIESEGCEIIEQSGLAGGYDTVDSSVSYVADEGIEEIILIGTGWINATGNDDANALSGNAGNNVLDGGVGGDSMYGRAGSDTYIVDSEFDIVADEEGDASTDRVRASVSFSLGTGLEDLILTGTGNINGTGNSLANTIRGNAGINILSGGLNAGTEVDRLYGYAGDDVLISLSGFAELFGGTGNDTYQVSSGDDEIVELAGQGTDVVRVAAGVDFDLAPNLENVVMESIGADDPANRVNGNASNNQITGNSGANVINGGGGNDTMTGLGGNDDYFVDSSADVVVEALDGGRDTIFASATYTIAANVEILQLIGAAAINGTGNTSANRINGNSGNNKLSGLDGADILSGGNGNDTLLGGNGNDLMLAGPGDDTYDGGADIDTVSYRRTAVGVVVNLANTAAQNTGAGNDRFVGIENLDGSDRGHDTLTGDGAANRLRGLGGLDVLNGGGGNDFLYGGEGADALTGGTGDDLLDGGNGGDQVSFYNSTASITVDLSLLGSQATGEGNDTLRSIENVGGSNTGNDRITGDAEDNSLSGFGGNDIIAGGDGADFMDGGDGNDTVTYAAALDNVAVDLARIVATDDFGLLDFVVGFENVIGGGFDDTLTGSAVANSIEGGLGRDLLRGNGGNDTFVYRAAEDTGTASATRDQILDWNTGDRIDLSVIDASSTVAGNQAFSFIGTGSFTGAGAQLRQVSASGGIVLEADIDGNNTADFSIFVRGSYTFAAADFAL